jgi:putative hydroxymethylpyrimidine transport system ATP-binding protein
LNLIRIIPAEAAVIPDIHLIDTGLSYRNKAVFAHIQLFIPAGTRLALLGASGVGKTSFLRMLAGLASPDESISGTIQTNNNILLQNQIAYMAQQDMLLPWLTTFDNAALSLKLRRYSSQDKTRKIERAHQLLEQAGLGSAKDLFPHQLSGGMRQRAALVRTLMEEKPIVLMDEPFSALDTITRFHLQNLASNMLSDKTIIFITHDPVEALRIADHVYLMEGAPANIELIATPRHAAPRDMHDQENIKLHADIFARLTAVEEMGT